jgi:hypothetical protein
MNRAALEHILRAASAISNEREFVVIGSQAVLGQFPAAPAALLASIEVDVYPRYAPDKSDLIDGALGELSAFHQSFGYYAHGVDDTTATLPAGSGISNSFAYSCRRPWSTPRCFASDSRRCPCPKAAWRPGEGPSSTQPVTRA